MHVYRSSDPVTEFFDLKAPYSKVCAAVANIRILSGLAFTCFAVLLPAVTGCGASRQYRVESISVDRVSWDSLRVKVAFSESSTLGKSRRVVPDVYEVRVFDQAIDTVYSGSELAFSVDDRSLKDKERLLVEVCATFHMTEVCAQEGVEASPKKVVVEDEIEYPRNDDYDSGAYDLRFSAERQVFGRPEEWESIPMARDASGRIRIQVVGGVGDGMTVSFSKPSGKLKLENVPNNADFRRDLLKGLLENNEAIVRFEVFTRAFELRDPVLVRDITVDAKSLETREVEAGLFVEETARRLVRMLRTFPLGPQRYAYLDSWSYDRDAKRYEVDLSFGWRSSFILARYFDLTGTLSVNEDGTEAVFELKSGNERGIRRWDQQFDSRTVTLDPLPVLAGASRRGARADE